jgi:hypothetical protein
MIALATIAALLPALRTPAYPTDALSQGLWLVLAAAVLAAAVSNRVQRGLRSVASDALCLLWLDRREARLRLLAPLERVGTLSEFLERLPSATASIAGVEPVTLFVLDHELGEYRPVSSTLVAAPGSSVGDDEPLAKALSRSSRVRYLSGRPDDLENAPIHAVNGPQVDECQAVCALPLRRDGKLVAFLLCGGNDGRRLGLRSSGCLESLVRRYNDILERCPVADVTVTARLARGTVGSRQSVNA